MTDHRPEPTTLIPASAGQFVLECVTEHCPSVGSRWTYTPIQTGDGLVLLPNLICFGCGCEPLAIKRPAWGQ